MKKLLTLLSAGALVAAVAVPSLAASKSIKVGDNFFKPKSVTVSKGTNVTWKFSGHVAHNVTVSKGPQKFHSSTRQSGTYTHKMTKRGTYTIICTIHPGMQMKLKVS